MNGKIAGEEMASSSNPSSSQMTKPSAQPSAAHTPGPWAAFNMVHAERGDAMTAEEIGEYVANSVRIGAPDRFLFISTGGDDAPDICHVGNGPAGPANARLIAAAPDLLEALKAEEDRSQRGVLAMTDDDIERLTRLRRAAIAKAEGRS